MAIMTLFMEFVVFHTIFEKLFREPTYEVSREDSELLPIYDSMSSYKPLSMERLYMINDMIEREENKGRKAI